MLQHKKHVLIKQSMIWEFANQETPIYICISALQSMGPACCNIQKKSQDLVKHDLEADQI